MLDDHAAEIFAKNKNMMVPYYIMASFAYYVEDNPIFSDGFYDNLAKAILNEWETISHWHKNYLNRDALAAGSYLGDYPTIAQYALQNLRDSVKSSKQQMLSKNSAPADTMGQFGAGLFDWGK